MSSTPPVTPTPAFDWKVFASRVVTIAVGAGLTAFAHTYTTTSDVKSSISAGIAAAIAGLVGGATYDQVKFQDSKR